MNCVWQDIPGSEKANGWRKGRCINCGTIAKLPPGPSDAIFCECIKPGSGPGTELTKLLKQLGAKPNSSCNCKAKAAEMDRLGAGGCQREKDRLVAWLKDAYRGLSWHDVAAFGARAVASGLALKMLAGGPAEWLVEEAVSRAEAQQPPSEHSQNPAQ